jgi:hypothetical protein
MKQPPTIGTVVFKLGAMLFGHYAHDRPDDRGAFSLDLYS